MTLSSRNAEIELIRTTLRAYLDLPTAELERLFEDALDQVEIRGLPRRGAADRSYWRPALERLKKEIAKQEVAASATAGLAASQAVDWAHSVGLDVSTFNVPIAIIVALAVKAVWGQMNSDDDRGADHDEQRDR